MRPVPRTLSVLLAALAAAAPLAAQAVERADVPAAGRLRLSFDPKIEAWDDAFWSGTRRPLGWVLTGDSVGGTIPPRRRLQQHRGTERGGARVLLTHGRASRG